MAAASATPLSPSVLAAIAKCPKMKTELENLQKDRWTVVWGSAGGGTTTDKKNKKIVLDPARCTTDEITLGRIAHEMGHAQYTPPSVSPNGRTKAEYIRDKVQTNLEDEGEATLKQIEYKNCLKNGGGPDIVMSGSKAAEYEAIAKKYPDAADRAKARTEIANTFGDSEKTSNCPAQTYRQYYESPCCAPACGKGAKGYADSFTDEKWKAMGGKI
jgi:type VI secretion system secreted protein VgrG